MKTSKPGRWAKIGRWLLLMLLIIVLVVFGYLVYVGFTYGLPDWTGFGQYTPPQPLIEGYQREKTLWDWLQLLIIPIVIAIGGFFLNRTERINAEKTAEQRANTERELGEQRAEVERKIAEQRALDAVLEMYLDRMADLLLNQKLLKSQPGDEVRQLARIRTLTALRRLDGERNKILLQFLYDADVLHGGSNVVGFDGGTVKRNSHTAETIIDLSRANLRNIDLKEANLRGVNLEEADLRGAELARANLQGANLQAAILHSASLLGADLLGANLTGAVIENTFLQGADLQGANMQDTQVLFTELKEANLRGANLQRAFFLTTSLRDANLQDANLTGAQLENVSLEGANLQGAIMPDGSTHE